MIYDIIEAKKAMDDFMKAPREDRLAFVTLIALPERTNW